MRKKHEIQKAINIVNNNTELTYGYREDVEAILSWVLGGEPFDGLDQEEGEIL